MGVRYTLRLSVPVLIVHRHLEQPNNKSIRTEILSLFVTTQCSFIHTCMGGDKYMPS